MASLRYEWLTVATLLTIVRAGTGCSVDRAGLGADAGLAVGATGHDGSTIDGSTIGESGGRVGQSTGGVRGTGGSLATGGNGSGGIGATGGALAPGAGGRAAAGGTIGSSGGAIATGGGIGSGGVSATGGTQSTGGSGTGGAAPATGGSGSGGSVSTGGISGNAGRGGNPAPGAGGGPNGSGGASVGGMSGTGGARANCSHFPGAQAFVTPTDDRTHCYWFHADRKTWPAARTLCQDESGDLVTILSAAENTFVFGLSHFTGDPSDIWIGATDGKVSSDATGPGTYRWVTGEKWEYTHWNVTSPAQPDGFCDPIVNGQARTCDHRGTLAMDGTWFDFWQDNPRAFMCEATP